MPSRVELSRAADHRNALRDVPPRHERHRRRRSWAGAERAGMIAYRLGHSDAEGRQVATTERTTIGSPCPCGQGSIAVTRTEPDHGYVRASQISYSAEIACAECDGVYEIRKGEYDAYPWVARVSDAERQRMAQERLTAVEAEVMASDEVGRLRRRIVAVVDGQPSMAAMHRVLRRFGLAWETVSTYRKRPYGGEEALRYSGASVFARIGSLADMGQADTSLFEGWARRLDSLEQEVRNLEPEPVQTGGTWLRA